MARLPSGLRFKLVLLVVIGITTAFTLIGGMRGYLAEQRIGEEMRRSGQERVATMAEAVANLLIGYDYSNMEALLERLVRQSDVKRAEIRNAKDKVMATRGEPLADGHASLPFEAPVYFDGRVIGTVYLELSLARMEAQIAQTYREVVLEQIFFGVLLGLLIYLATSWVIVKPIARINQRMQAQLATEETRAPEAIHIASRDEIGQLAASFNDLNRKVYEAQRRLQEKVDLAGTALMETNQQLQQRGEELERRGRELEQALSLVEQLAVTDSLTELRNRRYFDDTMGTAFARALRFGEDLTLILLDVDFFKHVNDHYGHAAGDLVLQTLSRIFKERTREIDVAARVGGDEFAFLLYQTGRDEGEVFARDLLNLVHEQRFVFEDDEVWIGLSIGLAGIREVLGADNPSVAALCRAADEALYEAKHRGRDQVVAYPFDSDAGEIRENRVILKHCKVELGEKALGEKALGEKELGEHE